MNTNWNLVVWRFKEDLDVAMELEKWISNMVISTSQALTSLAIIAES